MSYYDRDKNKIKFNIVNMKCIGEGTCGKVYKYNSNALKIYNDDAPNCARLKPEKFDIFKTITNPHFVKLYNIYTKKALPIGINKDFKTDAYELSYYEKDTTSIIEKPMDYLLDNLSEIEMLLTYLSNEHIQTDDLRYDNVVLQKNDIVIIDPDSFNIFTDSAKYIAHKNKENLVNLVNTILYHSIIEYDKSIYDKWRTNFFKYNINDNFNVTHNISKTLKKYKTLKDFFTNNHK